MFVRFTCILVGVSAAVILLSHAFDKPSMKLEAQESAAPPPPEGSEIATFAGGCFWCMEPPFDKLDGVISTISGYSGGEEKNPTYKEVSSGKTGHAEVVQVTFDPNKISYKKLLNVFWRNIDPTVKDRQFCDTGTQYRTEIFYHSPEQKKLAEISKEEIKKNKSFSGSIITPITKAGEFYPAEGYHQDYYRKNPLRYKSYRVGCGRDRRLKELWGDEN